MSDNGETGRHLQPVDARAGAMAQYDPHQFNDTADDSIDLQDLWRVVQKRRWVVISILAIFLAVAILATWLTVPMYRSTAVIQITHESGRILRIEDFEATPNSALDIEKYYQTQFDILRGRQLAEDVIKRLEIQDHPEFTGEIRQRSLITEIRMLPRRIMRIFRRSPSTENRMQLTEEQMRTIAIRRAGSILRSRILVVPRTNSRLVNVSVSSFDPALAARLANAVVQEYMRSTLQRRYDAGQEAREFLEGQLDEMRIALERADQNLVDFAQANGVADLQERIDMAKASLRTLNDRLAEAEADLVQMRAYRELIEAGQGSSIRLVTDDPEIRGLQEEKADLATDYVTLSQRFMDDYPSLVEMRTRMAGIDNQIAKRGQSIIDGVLTEYQNLQSEIGALNQAISTKEGEILQLSQRGVQYNILRREFETNEELFDGMLQRLREIGIAAGVQENNIAVIESALRSGRPYKPKILRNLGLGLILGLVIGVLLALLLEFLDTTIRWIDDAEKLVGRPVLGLIPMVKLREPGKRFGIEQQTTNRAVSHYSELHPKSAVSEAFRSLRTSLAFSTPQGLPKTLLVTSPGPGDGKTTSAINLATVIAQNGKKVLIIDADLRKPRLHRDFSVPHAPGLTNRIAGINSDEAGASSPIIPTTVEGLFVMPSGNQAPNPAELLGSDRMQKILSMAARAFDHVIVDSAPVLGLADSLVLSRCVDGLIMVVAAGKTTKDHIKASTRRLQQVQAPFLGLVLNRVDLDSPDYAYYSAYYYNYGYGSDEDIDAGSEESPKKLGQTA